MNYSTFSRLLLALSFCQMPAIFGHEDCEEEEGPHFSWSDEKSVFADIKMEVAGPGVIQNFVEVSGRVVTHPDHYSYVIPKADGIVWEIRKNLGDWVEKDEVLALIESKEVAEAKTHYLAALKQLNVQQILLKKEESLRHISAAQDYLKAELAKEEAAHHFDCALQSLYTLGFSDKEINQISQETPAVRRFYAVKAPIRGKVLQRNLSLGEQVDHGAKAFTIANFDKVCIEIHVAQNDVKYLKEGVPISILGFEEKKAHVKICQFDPSISEETRTAIAIATMDNTEGYWSPGEYVSARVQTSYFNVPLMVLREAVQNIKGEHYVFVEEAGTLIPCIVKVGKMDEQSIEIVAGLKPGDHYAACNAFCLKAEFEKEDAEHEH